jgi:hypothetical protein
MIEDEDGGWRMEDGKAPAGAWYDEKAKMAHGELRIESQSLRWVYGNDQEFSGFKCV